ncbi:cyclophilin-like fold protein [Paraburkholderia strydomiana]|uniref:cyclophilin-like fold protein n=1 Tax=Paraburkholderia strydomiana TaxID=1245417 RepID=UPI0038BBC022
MKSCRLTVLTAVLAAIGLPFVSHCAAAQEGQSNAANVPTVPEKGKATVPNRSTELTRIKLSFESGEAVVELNDNPTSRDLVSMLPLTLKFRDYNGVEKVAYPPRKLSTAGAPFGLTPSVGDFALYAPWGNLVAYYRGFRHSNDLVHLGRFTSGIEQLSRMDGEFSVRIEAVK